jgi:hypothetical protein
MKRLALVVMVICGAAAPALAKGVCFDWVYGGVLHETAQFAKLKIPKPGTVAPLVGSFPAPGPIGAAPFAGSISRDSGGQVRVGLTIWRETEVCNVIVLVDDTLAGSGTLRCDTGNNTLSWTPIDCPK